MKTPMNKKGDQTIHSSHTYLLDTYHLLLGSGNTVKPLFQTDNSLGKAEISLKNMTAV